MALSLLTCRPGVKLQLHGNMVCRLGVLLLGPSNVKVLGGEVEDLVERNSQVNCGILKVILKNVCDNFQINCVITVYRSLDVFVLTVRVG